MNEEIVSASQTDAAVEFRQERMACLFQSYAEKIQAAQCSCDGSDWFVAYAAWKEFHAHASRGNFYDDTIARIVCSATSRLDFALRQSIDRISLHAESPIETVFELAAYAAAALRSVPLSSFDPDDEPERLNKSAALTPQKRIGAYRADFLLSCIGEGGRICRLAVECDGYEFHERTPEQASSDRAKDRSLQEAGLDVFRFTGSDIYRDPYGCADQVMTWVKRHRSICLSAGIDEGHAQETVGRI